MSAQLIQLAELGRCRVELVQLDEHWLLFLRTPPPLRIDFLSAIIRQTGGHFGGSGNNTAIVYDVAGDAFGAFSLMVDSIQRDGFMPRLIGTPPGPPN